jgi:oligopeptide transport system substrate-binding protein
MLNQEKESGQLFSHYMLIMLLALLVCLPDKGSAQELNGSSQPLNKGITLSIINEPRSLNTLTAESVSYSAQLMAHVQEGLMRYDGRRRLVGGVAERWEVTPSTIHFWLRQDARWQDGSPVTAHDFAFAWRNLVKPTTGSPSANLASPIKNAAKIIKGELGFENLGVQVLNSKELLIELEHPCSWCLKLMTNSIFYPINERFYEGVKAESGIKSYGTSPQNHLSNGAFRLARWTRGKRISLVKNDQYWRQREVELTAIDFSYIGIDSRTRLNLFKAGDIAVAMLDRDSVTEALEAGLRMKTFPSGHLFHIQFSHRQEKLSSNLNLRKAISLSIDKDELVNRVVASPGTRRSDSMFHDWMTLGDTKLIDLVPPPAHQKNIPEAKRYLEVARKQLNISGNIKLTLTINDSGTSRRVAEYIQHELLSVGIELVIDPQVTQMMVEKWRSGISDLTLLTWPVDVDDPMDQISFMGNPDFREVFQGLYAEQDMASLFYLTRDALTIAAKVAAIKDVQVLFDKKVTVLPLFESYGTAIVSRKLKGFVWQPVRGYADYRYARVLP